MSKKVRVYVRIKPKITTNLKIKNSGDVMWRTEGVKVFRTDAHKETCFNGYNGVFHLEDNKEIYKRCIKDLVSQFLENQNCTVFAYGQTGSGKTYTILGDDKVEGIISLCLEDILKDTQVHVSYMEIYNEKIYDLFSNTELQIYTIENTPVVSNLSSSLVSSPESLQDFLGRCENNRKYGSTEYNEKSSRSHSIFQVRNGRSIFNLIDLAGSEKASENENRRKEGSFINKSLLALCNLVSNIQRNKYFGYRDSKLTRLLQPSLDGKTNIVALCMISQEKCCLEESIATLKFAGRLSSLEIKVTEKSIPKKETVISSKQGFYLKHYLKKKECVKGMVYTLIEPPNQDTKESTKEEDTKEEDTKEENVVGLEESKKFEVKESDKKNLNYLDSLTEEKDSSDCVEFKEKVDFYELNDSKINKLEKERLLLFDRIASLEKMVIDFLKRNPSKRMKEIFILEKHMFNLQLKKYYEDQNPT